METIARVLAAAQELCRAGKMHEAEVLCQTVLRSAPQTGEAWRLLAGIAQQTGRVDRAIEYGQQAARFLPASAEVLSDLGSVLLLRGRADEAVAALARAVELQPEIAGLHFNLGNALKIQKQYEEAIASYRRAIALNPQFVEALSNLAALHQEVAQYDEALRCCRDLLFHAPEYAIGWSILGNVYKSLEAMDKAAEAYERALALAPNLVEALAGLAAARESEGRFEEAIQICRRALELRPDYAVAHNNLGTALEHSGYLAEAEACFSRAAELDPEYVEPHLNRSVLRLHALDFERGWDEYEWRWKTREAQWRPFERPHWEGEPLAGRTILLHAEQGFGDTIQFIRYAALVKRLGARVIVECQKPLMRLLASFRGIDQLLARGDELPPHDFHAPLMSLPRVFKTRVDSIPAEIPYLAADPGLVAAWREKLQTVPGFRVGINWRGRGGIGVHRRRDLPLDVFAPLAAIPGVRLISLQKGATAEELGAFAGPLAIVDSEPGFDEAHGPFMDTAAIIANLDLIISSDTSIAHLAGALGRRVWLLANYLPCWRWQLNRSDSPWYPTMRIFRQPTPGDWRGALAEVQSALLAQLRGAN